MTDSPAAQQQVRKSRRCANCGEEFVPYHSGERFCGNNMECSKAEEECEREAYEARREAAEQDEYGRY